MNLLTRHKSYDAVFKAIAGRLVLQGDGLGISGQELLNVPTLKVISVHILIKQDQLKTLKQSKPLIVM